MMRGRMRGDDRWECKIFLGLSLVSVVFVCLGEIHLFFFLFFLFPLLLLVPMRRLMGRCIDVLECIASSGAASMTRISFWPKSFVSFPLLRRSGKPVRGECNTMYPSNHLNAIDYSTSLARTTILLEAWLVEKE
jgi:hypothetical protein